MRMNRIEPAKRREELAGFQLQIERQASRLHECFFDFHFRFIVVIQFENNIGKTFEVRVHRTVECELSVACVESPLLRIVIAHFDVLEIVSGADVTTEVSVVGKPPGAGVPLTAGAVADATTDVSSVGKRGGTLSAGAAGPSAAAMGEGSGFCGSPDSPVRFAFSNAAC